MSNGINQIGIPKFQHPWRSLLTSRNSGTWGNRGKGNEIQSTLENVIDFFTDISGKQKLANKERDIITGTAPIPTFKSVSRFSMNLPLRSDPSMDLFRLQIPSFKTGKLGFGHYYRAVRKRDAKIKPLQEKINKANADYMDVQESMNKKESTARLSYYDRGKTLRVIDSKLPNWQEIGIIGLGSGVVGGLGYLVYDQIKGNTERDRRHLKRWNKELGPFIDSLTPEEIKFIKNYNNSYNYKHPKFRRDSQLLKRIQDERFENRKLLLKQHKKGGVLGLNKIIGL